MQWKLRVSRSIINTDYYKVTITDVNGTTVSMDTLWRFINGTEITVPQTIDLSNGHKTDQYRVLGYLRF